MLLSLRQHPRKGKEFVFAPLRPRTRLNLLRLSAETCVAAPNFPPKLQLMGSDSWAPSVCWNGGGYAVMEGGVFLCRLAEKVAGISESHVSWAHDQIIPIVPILHLYQKIKLQKQGNRRRCWQGLNQLI